MDDAIRKEHQRVGQLNQAICRSGTQEKRLATKAIIGRAEVDRHATVERHGERATLGRKAAVPAPIDAGGGVGDRAAEGAL